MRNARMLVSVLLLSGAVVTAKAQAPSELDLTTPRGAMRHFLNEAREGHWEAAARVLDVSALPPGAGARDGARLAKQLSGVLDETLWVDIHRLSDEPTGNPADGADLDLVGEIPFDGRAVPLTLTRRADGSWRISATTLAVVPELAARYGGTWLREHLPAAFFTMRVLEVAAWQWLALLLFMAGGLVVALLLSRLIERVGRRIARKTAADWDDQLIETLHGPLWLFLWLALFSASLGLLHLAVPARAAVMQLLRTAFVIVTTWAGLRMTSFIAHIIEARLTGNVADPTVIRGVRTQVRVLRRVVAVVIAVVGAALVLMQFDIVRNVGASLLASAGVAGIVIGLAAQRSISMLLAGIQISLTQPIRIGDTVIVENEWGWIEEITLTYVVVRVWDLRRLVVPVTRFLEQPFQNWTKVTPDIMGTVSVFADYTVPVGTVREELSRMVKGDPNWDGKVVGLQVTEATDRVVTLRALVSSADAGRNWDLRCDVREKLIAYLRDLEGGRYLPRSRVDVTAASPSPSPASIPNMSAGRVPA